MYRNQTEQCILQIKLLKTVLVMLSCQSNQLQVYKYLRLSFAIWVSNSWAERSSVLRASCSNFIFLYIQCTVNMHVKLFKLYIPVQCTVNIHVQLFKLYIPVHNIVQLIYMYSCSNFTLLYNVQLIEVYSCSNFTLLYSVKLICMYSCANFISLYTVQEYIVWTALPVY